MTSGSSLEIFGDFDHDGRRDKKPLTDKGKGWLIIPLTPQTEENAPAVTLFLRNPDGDADIPVSITGGTTARLFVREGDHWREPKTPPSVLRREPQAYSITVGKAGIEIGVMATQPVRASEFTLILPGHEILCRVAAVLLTSSLDPAEEVFVVRNPRNRRFVAELTRLVAQTEGKPKLRTIDTASASSDLWMQDTVEIARFAYPAPDGKTRQGIAPILGLRAKHDRGLECGPLDTAVRAYFENATPDAVTIEAGEPLPDRRWIDWFGNMEVSPPIKGFPYGRILTGDQKGLRFHPAVLEFLELQKLQWPPLFVNVSWLTIGHVDEIINFVPAPDRQGFRALMPSPALARRLLEEAARSGNGETPVFAGTKEQTTVTRLLNDIARSKENAAIDAALQETRQQAKNGLSIEDADIIEIPALFADGLAVIPNMVNCLVLGRDLLIPAPAGPVIQGEDLFQKSVRAQLEPLRARLHFMDIWEPYHTRSGEIHCGTNAIRRLRNPDWWKTA